MSELRKLAEAKKAKILADAQQKAAEVDRDMADLERLTAKYNLAVSEPAEAGAELDDSDIAIELGEEPAVPAIAGKIATALSNVGDVSDFLATIQHIDDVRESTTKRARTVAEAYIRAKNRPAPLGELYDFLADRGIKFDSDNPRNTLSAVLGHDSSPLYSISRLQGWWIKGLELPALRRVV